MKTKELKKGVSLIVLVITVIVMVILAGVIILTLDNSGIINKAQDAVDQANLAEVKNIAQLAWAEAFLDGKTTKEELETEVLNKLNKQNIDVAQYEITVSENGVSVTLKGTESNAWVIATVDTVPIPKGFVASSATGENTKNGGLVIYEGTEPVTDANVETAKRTRNQYVWVPVEDFSKFVRDDGIGGVENLSNTLGEGAWELVLDITTNMPLSVQDENYVSSTTLAEAQAMYSSIREHKGFYIARYEAGTDNHRTQYNNVLESQAYSMMGKLPYNMITCKVKEETTGAIAAARNIYPTTNTNYGVVSTLTYGVQWDATYNWLLQVGAKDSEGNTIETHNGNVHRAVETTDFNEDAKYANIIDDVSYMSEYPSYQEVGANFTYSGYYLSLSTGALKVACINNIYDISGNMSEWTMEVIGSGVYDGSRLLRGLSFWGNSGHRLEDAGPGNMYIAFGFRSTLYIKQ